MIVTRQITSTDESGPRRNRREWPDATDVSADPDARISSVMLHEGNTVIIGWWDEAVLNGREVRLTGKGNR